MKTMDSIILHKLPARFLLSLYDSGILYGAELRRLLNTDQAQVYVIRNKLERAGLIWYYTDGRTVKIKLTDKGHEVASWFSKLRDSLKISEARL